MVDANFLRQKTLATFHDDEEDHEDDESDLRLCDSSSLSDEEEEEVTIDRLRQLARTAQLTESRMLFEGLGDFETSNEEAMHLELPPTVSAWPVGAFPLEIRRRELLGGLTSVLAHLLEPISTNEQLVNEMVCESVALSAAGLREAKRLFGQDATSMAMTAAVQVSVQGPIGPYLEQYAKVSERVSAAEERLDSLFAALKMLSGEIIVHFMEERGGIGLDAAAAAATTAGLLENPEVFLRTLLGNSEGSLEEIHEAVLSRALEAYRGVQEALICDKSILQRMKFMRVFAYTEINTGVEMEREDKELGPRERALKALRGLHSEDLKDVFRKAGRILASVYSRGQRDSGVLDLSELLDVVMARVTCDGSRPLVVGKLKDEHREGLTVERKLEQLLRFVGGRNVPLSSCAELCLGVAEPLKIPEGTMLQTLRLLAEKQTADVMKVPPPAPIYGEAPLMVPGVARSRKVKSRYQTLGEIASGFTTSSVDSRSNLRSFLPVPEKVRVNAWQTWLLDILEDGFNAVAGGGRPSTIQLEHQCPAAAVDLFINRTNCDTGKMMRGLANTLFPGEEIPEEDVRWEQFKRIHPEIGAALAEASDCINRIPRPLNIIQGGLWDMGRETTEHYKQIGLVERPEWRFVSKESGTPRGQVRLKAPAVSSDLGIINLKLK